MLGHLIDLIVSTQTLRFVPRLSALPQTFCTIQMSSFAIIFTLLLTAAYGAKYLRSSGNTSITTLSSSDVGLISNLAAKYNCRETFGKGDVLATVNNIIQANSEQVVSVAKECQTFGEKDAGAVSKVSMLHKDYCDETKSNLAEEQRVMEMIRGVLLEHKEEHTWDTASL